MSRFSQKIVTRVETLYLPSTFAEAGQSAFEGCSSLQRIYYSGSRSKFESVKIADLNAPFSSAEVIFS